MGPLLKYQGEVLRRSLLDYLTRARSSLYFYLKNGQGILVFGL